MSIPKVICKSKWPAMSSLTRAERAPFDQQVRSTCSRPRLCPPTSAVRPRLPPHQVFRYQSDLAPNSPPSTKENHCASCYMCIGFLVGCGGLGFIVAVAEYGDPSQWNIGQDSTLKIERAWMKLQKGWRNHEQCEKDRTVEPSGPSIYPCEKKMQSFMARAEELPKRQADLIGKDTCNIEQSKETYRMKSLAYEEKNPGHSCWRCVTRMEGGADQVDQQPLDGCSNRELRTTVLPPEQKANVSIAPETRQELGTTLSPQYECVLLACQAEELENERRQLLQDREALHQSQEAREVVVLEELSQIEYTSEILEICKEAMKVEHEKQNQEVMEVANSIQERERAWKVKEQDYSKQAAKYHASKLDLKDGGGFSIPARAILGGVVIAAATVFAVSSGR